LQAQSASEVSDTHAELAEAKPEHKLMKVMNNPKMQNVQYTKV
jgi:hypothetical protein